MTKRNASEQATTLRYKFEHYNTKGRFYSLNKKRNEAMDFDGGASQGGVFGPWLPIYMALLLVYAGVAVLPPPSSMLP